MTDTGMTQQETELLRVQVETFNRINAFVSSIYNLDNLLDLIMREAEAAVEAEASCIALYAPSDGRLHMTFASGEHSEKVRHLSIPLNQGILGTAAATGATIRTSDARQDPRWDPSVDKKTGFTSRSIMATPIRRRENLLGALEVINKLGGSQFTDEDGRVLEVVATQAAIAIENARLFEQMVQSERLSVVGRMAASVIHDLKKPMSVIRGFAELLGSSRLDAEKRREISNLVLQDVDRFVDMTQEVLDYSRGNIGLAPAVVQAGEWLESVLKSIEVELAGSKVELAMELGYRGPVYIDATRMRRVLVNIVRNAIDAMPDGGTFSVETRRHNDDWELDLRDNGLGIPPELRHRLFEPFATSGKEHGTGLGLAIVREIVEGHGGTIRVQSRVEGEEPGQPSGSTFSIRMPIGRPAKPAA